MFHFAYGSNLSHGFLRSNCPSASFVMKAYLPNFRVEFRFYSERRGGISTIVAYPGALTRGGIYEVPEEEMAVLDEVEGVPRASMLGRHSSCWGRWLA